MNTDRYRIRQIIGEGATSTVYLAQDTLENIDVAIKSQSVSISSSNKEFAILSRINYEHIIQLKNFIEENRQTYLITEACDCNLIHFINNYDVDIRCIKKIMRMVLLGIKCLHDQGIIHRDIKLGNILIKDNNVKLCDFGLSCYEKDNDFSYCGTRDYLAPEIYYNGNQNNDCKYDRKVDIYAAGMVFKILLSRKKDIKIDDIKHIDNDMKIFLKNLLKDNSLERFSVDEALKDHIFSDLFVEIPDFRLIKEFSKVNKRGIIIRRDNFVSIENTGDKIITNKIALKIEYLEQQCKCKGQFISKIILNGSYTDKEFLSNSQLKYFNYVCSYLKALSERTSKIKISEKGFLFTYFLNDSYLYVAGDLKIKAEMVHDHFNYIINNKVVDEVPHINILAQLESRCRLLFANTCICSHNHIDDSRSILNLSLSGLDSISLLNRNIYNDLTPNNAKFIDKVGWCIKNDLQFTFLLNDGNRFILNAVNNRMIVNNKEFSIDKNLNDENIRNIKIIRIFLPKFVSSTD